MSKNEFDALLLKKLEEEVLEYNPDSWKQLSDQLDIALPHPETTPSFDALLVTKLGESSFEYDPANWDKLSGKLAPDATQTHPFPSRKWGIAIGSAAAVCLAIGLAVIFSHKDAVTPALTHQKATEQPVLPQQPVSTPNAITTPAVPAATPADIAATQKPHAPATPIRSFLPVNEQTHDTFNGDRFPARPQQPDHIAVAQPNTGGSPAVKQELPEPAVTKQEPGKDFLANQTPGWSPVFTGNNNNRNAAPKTNISFGGGVNYGNLNTGYTAGISVKRNLSSDFFVDGTVAMMYNNNATNVAANNGPSVNDNIAARPTSFESSSISSPALDPMQRLYYLQVNPSFGYQIEDKVALSVGGDFQQILNKREEIVRPNNSDTKIFPNFDVGITTKSEFSISPNIQAGLVYREGLNNLLRGDGGKYVNRRYFQVQFKYNLPLK